MFKFMKVKKRSEKNYKDFNNMIHDSLLGKIGLYDSELKQRVFVLRMECRGGDVRNSIYHVEKLYGLNFRDAGGFSDYNISIVDAYGRLKPIIRC